MSNYFHWLGNEPIKILNPNNGQVEVVKRNPLDSQIGGQHYKQYKVQPVEYAMANSLNYCQANAIKYITRYRDKNGKEDLLKAIHNLEILIQLEYGGNDSGNAVV